MLSIESRQPRALHPSKEINMTTRTLHAKAPRMTSLASRAAAASILAVVTNLALYLLASAGWLGQSVLSPAEFGIGLGAVASMSAGPAFVAALLLAELQRWTPWPTTAFLAVAGSVYAGFLAGPFTLGAPTGTIVLLELMHVVVALSAVRLLLHGSRG
jgi:hypothetical protein